MADKSCDDEVNEHADEADTFWGDAKEVVFLSCDELEVDDVAKCEEQTTNHTSDTTLLVNPFGKNTHKDCWEEG